jgi:hypothetical protein
MYQGLVHAMLTALCPQLLQAGLYDARIDSPAGNANKQFFGYHAHTPQDCAKDNAPGPWVWIACVVKPDGRICMIVWVQSQDAAAGDVLPWVLRKQNGDPILSGNDPLGSTVEPVCPV